MHATLKPVATDHIALSEVPLLPRIPRRPDGRPIDAAEVSRWAFVGIAGVRLRTARSGRAKYTTVEWVEEFFSALRPNDQAC